MSTSDFQVIGNNANALFTLKVHRGDGMALLAMNWKNGEPPNNFVGFAMEYKEPDGDEFFPIKNRIAFPGEDGDVNPNRLSSRQSPFQMFRWVHFPRFPEKKGLFTYRVLPVFMNDERILSFGEPQEASLALARETYPDRLNVCFTRGYVSSQSFVDRYGKDGVPKLVAPKAHDGLRFKPTHPKKDDAYRWMGFEARSAILELLDQAIANENAEVFVVAYELNMMELVSRLETLGERLHIIIDDSKTGDTAESQAAKILRKSAGSENVKRQHMGALQHNKTIVVDGPGLQKVVCGSTNFSWRGFYVQSNNAMILTGEAPVKIFRQAFENYWDNDDVSGFGGTPSAKWSNLELDDIDAKVSFSPHIASNALLKEVADDIADTTSSLFFSLAFLSTTQGVVRKAVKKIVEDEDIFSYGISDKETGGFDLSKPDGKVAPVFPAALTKNVPEPFKSEAKGGGGNRMHHKFAVIDFDKPAARVYLGSYNFSPAADRSNGENLLLVRDRRVAVSYMVEALRIFDQYHFRVNQEAAKKAKKKLQLAFPPKKKSEKPWWKEFYVLDRKIKDRKLFS